MSLIVDINPVPWEILDRVKARLLRNRTKKSKQQAKKPEALRRVMPVDDGILAKQRWEEPSFIFTGEDRIPYIVIVVGGPDSRRVIKSRPKLEFNYVSLAEGPDAPYSYVPDPSSEGGWFFGMWVPSYIKIYYNFVQNYTYLGTPVYETIGDITVKLNELTIGVLTPPPIDTFIAYLFTWSNDSETHENIKKTIANNQYGERIARKEFTITTIAPTSKSGAYDIVTPPSDEDSSYYLIKLNWQVIVIDDVIVSEPEIEQELQLSLIPESIGGQRYGDSENKRNTAIHYGFIDPVNRIVTINPVSNVFTAYNSDFSVNDVIVFYEIEEDLPAPLNKKSKYFVRGEGLTISDFTISSNYNGSILDITGSAAGNYVVNYAPATLSVSTAISQVRNLVLKFS